MNDRLLSQGRDAIDPSTRDELPEIGRQLELAREHESGLHREPRGACWRCTNAALSDR